MGGGRGGGRGCEGRVTGRSDLLSFTCHQEIFFITFLTTYYKKNTCSLQRARKSKRKKTTEHSHGQAVSSNIPVNCHSLWKAVV